MNWNNLICSIVPFYALFTQPELVRGQDLVTSDEAPADAQAVVIAREEAQAAQVQSNKQSPHYWSIDFIANSTKANTTDGGVSITQEYMIGNEENIFVNIYSYDCKTKDDGILFSTDFESVVATERFKLYVNVSVAPDKIMESTYWDAEMPSLRFCVRVDLVQSPGISVSFYNTKVEVIVDMTVDFQTGLIAVDNLTPMSEITATDLWYLVTSCLCGGVNDPECSNTTLQISQNELFSICVKPLEDYLQIDRVLEFSLSQNGTGRTQSVSSNDALASFTVVERTHVISTWARAEFFSDENPPDVTGEGQLKLSHVAPVSRHLGMRSRNYRMPMDDTGSFQFSAHLEKEIVSDELLEGAVKDVPSEGRTLVFESILATSLFISIRLL